MNEPLAYLNGKLIAHSALSVPVYDAGFVLGATVAEQLRTFSGKLFRLEEHLERLRSSLQVVSLDQLIDIPHLGEIAKQLVDHNHPRLPAGQDLGLCIFVTPGPYRALAPSNNSGPTVGVHTYPLSFHFWADKYESGEHLVTTSIKQVSVECWPPQLKCRSRMHYFLADQQANAKVPGSRALLLDADGFVCESSTANVVVYFAEQGLVIPLADKILAGISLAELIHLAAELNIPLSHRDMTVAEIAQADEIMLCSTSSCVMPVVLLNSQAVGMGKPGPIFQRLIAAWSNNVGVDIINQATKNANLSQE